VVIQFNFLCTHLSIHILAFCYSSPSINLAYVNNVHAIVFGLLIGK